MNTTTNIEPTLAASSPLLIESRPKPGPMVLSPITVGGSRQYSCPQQNCEVIGLPQRILGRLGRGVRPSTSAREAHVNISPVGAFTVFFIVLIGALSIAPPRPQWQTTCIESCNGSFGNDG
jgi:hypothetical protein